jgi:hypothetical protein
MIFKSFALFVALTIVMQYKVNASANSSTIVRSINFTLYKLDLKTVDSMTFIANKMTINRRVNQVPQLKCIQPTQLCVLYKKIIDVVICDNNGVNDTGNIQWVCTCSTVPITVRLSTTNVICEGYNKPNDTYQLAV